MLHLIGVTMNYLQIRYIHIDQRRQEQENWIVPTTVSTLISTKYDDALCHIMLDMYIHSHREDGKIILYPSRWINRGRIYNKIFFF